MIELVDMTPDVNVLPGEYRRLLGYPPEYSLCDRALDLFQGTPQWYESNGRPWIYAREVNAIELAGGAVCLDGERFHSHGLHFALAQAEAQSAFLVAVSAGPEIEREAQRRWREEKPDEYFFLEVYGSAVVEHLVTACGAHLCDWAEPQQMCVLPHLSPGYADWDVAEQPQLLQLMRGRKSKNFPQSLDVLPSGMLQPKKSLLAVFGITRHAEHVRRLSALSSCERCSFMPCQYRRSPYRRGHQISGITISSSPPLANGNSKTSAHLDQTAAYKVNRKALARWASERLALDRREDGTITAVFRYEGTTCTNLGRRLLFDYYVTLGPPDEGYLILSQRCVPAPDDLGHTSMCQYLENPRSLMASIDSETPLHGEPLNSVLNWNAPATVAGCYCESSDRMHKWRLVLETIHYALAQHERQQAMSARQIVGAR